MAITLADLKRNDLDGARRYYEAYAPITPDEFQALLLLQDDPVQLVDISADWFIHKPESQKSEWERLIEA